MQFDDFESNFEWYARKYKLVNISLPAYEGTTLEPKDVDIFDLKSPVLIQKFNGESYVKRIIIPRDLAFQFIRKDYGKANVDSIVDQFKKETGCTSVTFESPDGDYVRDVVEGFEIRIYGRK